MNEKDIFNELTADLKPEVPEGYVKIDDEAIEESIRYIRMQKEYAVEQEDFEGAAGWRDAEKQMLAARALGGLVRID